MSASLEILLAALVQRLDANTAAQQAFRAELAAYRAELAGDPTRPEYAALLRAIDAAFPKASLSCSDLVEACHSNKPGIEKLRSAIVAAARAVNARNLGKLFERIEGYDLGGLQVVRGKKQNVGVVWRVAPAVTMKKTTVTKFLPSTMAAKHDAP